MESVSAALKLVDVKKESLRKAFEALQAHSSSLSSFNLTWSDLESHFSSQISSIQSYLSILQCQQKPQFQRPPSRNAPSAPRPARPELKSLCENILQCQQKPKFQRPPSPNAPPAPRPARPELKSLCQKMDGLGLRNYVMERPSERTAICVELRDAFRFAPDPAGLVLAAVEEGFHEPILDSCVMLLERMAALRPEIGDEVKEKAKKLSEGWKEKASGGGVNVENNSLACEGFLYLVAAYGLVDFFDMRFLIECAFVVVKNSTFKQSVKLCRVVGLNVPDLIWKLKMTGNNFLAVKFICKFKLTKKFPPVPILKKHVELSKKLIEAAKNREKGAVALRIATAKEVESLKLVILIIKERNFKYPKEELVRYVKSVEDFIKKKESLEKDIIRRERGVKAAGLPHSAQTPISNPPPQQANTHDPSGSNHPKNQEPCDKMTISKTVIPPPASEPQQQSKPQEPSESNCLKIDQPGDATVASERVTDESKQSVPVPASKPQQQSKPHDELSGSKRLRSDQPGDTTVASESVTDESKQSKPHEPSESQPPNQENSSKRVSPPASESQQQSEAQEPSASKRLKCDTTVASERVADESKQSAPALASNPQQQYKPYEPSGSRPPNAEQVGHKIFPNGAVAASSNFGAFPQSHFQPAGPAGPWPARPFSYVASTAGPRSWGGPPYPIAAPNTGPPASSYGSSIGGPFRVPGNPRPPGPPHVYPPEQPPPPVGYRHVPPEQPPPPVGYRHVPPEQPPPPVGYRHVPPEQPPPPVGYRPVPYNRYGLPLYYHRQ